MFTLTLDPRELGRDPWGDDVLEVRLRGVEGRTPGSAADGVTILRRYDTFRAADVADENGVWHVELYDANMWPSGYEARFGVTMPWTFVPSDKGQQFLATLNKTPVAPPPEQSQVDKLLDLIADLEDRLAALEAGGVTPAPGKTYPGSTTYPSSSLYPMGA